MPAMAYRVDDRLELALRASNEGIWDWDITTDEIHYSGRILRFLGYRRDEVPHLFHHFEMVHDSDRDEYVEKLKQVLRPGGVDLFAVEPRMRTAKDEWRCFRIRGVVVRDAEGHALRMAGSMIDITARKEAEAQLLDERHLIRLLIDNVPLNIYFKDRESRFTLVNQSQAKWLGVGSEEDLIGKTDHDFFEPEHADRALQDEQQILATGKPILGYVERETLVTGEDAWVLTTKMPLFDRKGQIIGTFGVSNDVTELVRTQRSLAETAAALQRRNDEIEEELKLAREVQQALLPTRYPAIPQGSGEKTRLVFGHRYIPISGLAGDFFEVFPVGSRAAGMLICDVMGHGVRSAIVVSMLRGLAERAETEEDLAGDPAAFLDRLNEGLCSILQQAGVTMFATAFYVVVDLDGGELRYASAGHPAGIIRGEEGASVLPLGGRGSGPALGLFPDAQYEHARYPLSAVKQLLLFTDGIFEVQNQRGEEFLQNRLAELVGTADGDDIDTLLDEVLERVLAFAESERFDDDVCLLAMEVREE
ncbi:MAG: SpoIIE family protein phosphatase [Akkermansiaceae bacterium]|nr:SpoIIE family protein phosphatase [Akkermansiaceae bacterium]NNM27927.1 SpoIIE family protein phosphatase [Akkermansiaceae bacterium]